jgi:hypothetical protein
MNRFFMNRFDMNRYTNGWWPTLIGAVAMCLVVTGYVYTHPEPLPIDFSQSPPSG